MNILYYSVHSILEYDEIGLFKSLGHTVFPLGVNFGFKAAQAFRDDIVFNEDEAALLKQFYEMDCHYRFGSEYAAETRLTAEFIALFDVVVVMHDVEFIDRFWPVLSQRPVIWRTIGQGVELWEPAAAQLKQRGMHIVRYSPIERRARGYCGETALIRFTKRPSDYGPWTGHSAHVLSFSNMLAQRYPVDVAIFRPIVEGVPVMLGGVGNEGLPGAVGFLSPQQQIVHYNACRAYLYCSGTSIPYTLNFMEAFMTGMPVVTCSQAMDQTFCEIPAMLADDCGIVAPDPQTARAELLDLLANHKRAAAIGARGRARAIELFSSEHIGPQWNAVFDSIL